MTHLIVMIVRKKTRPYDFTVTIVSKCCFVTVVIKLDGWVENEDLRPKTQKRRPPQNQL